MLTSILTTRQICELAGIAKGQPTKRTQDRERAFTALNMALAHAFGGKVDELFLDILASANCKVALEKLRSAIVNLKKGRGEPTAWIEAATINGMGEELVRPQNNQRTNRMDTQTTELPGYAPSNVENANTTDQGASPDAGAEGHPPASKKVRVSAYAGHILTYVGPRAEDGSPSNPRKPGSHGHRSISIIIEAGADGISYEDYATAGGRANDLKWDIDHKHVAATPR